MKTQRNHPRYCVAPVTILRRNALTKVLFGLAIVLASLIFSPGSAAAGATTRLYVNINNPLAVLGGSCRLALVPCKRITDALARAREIRYQEMTEPDYSEATVRPIEIIIAAGNYRGTFGDDLNGTLEEYPLLINVPRVTLRGATYLALDERGRPKVPPSDAALADAVLNGLYNTVLLMREQEVRQANEYIFLVLPTIHSATGRRTSGGRDYRGTVLPRRPRRRQWGGDRR